MKPDIVHYPPHTCTLIRICTLSNMWTGPVKENITEKNHTTTFWVAFLYPLSCSSFFNNPTAPIYHIKQQHGGRSGTRRQEPKYFPGWKMWFPPPTFSTARSVLKHNITCSLLVTLFFFSFSEKHPNYHAGELGKDGFYVVFISQTQYCHGFIYLCSYSNRMLSCNWDYYREGWHVFSTRLKAISVLKATIASSKTPCLV